MHTVSDPSEDLTPERFAQIRRIFEAAMEMPSGSRTSFLESACDRDIELQMKVERLLEAAEQTYEMLDRPALEIDTEDSETTTCVVRGPVAQIGRYRIISVLGEGGMGIVYEAEQEHPRRPVALKVIRPGLADSELLRRFKQEAQALGRLQHPGIAQVYEAATADAGFGPQPYFAMELIRGDSLLHHAEAHQLDTRTRLELMLKICEAVHHAHQRGIIHRDLKPSNILVDESGQPKILDFGVSRVTDRDSQATRQTEMGKVVGTLVYMSPEQMLGDPLELDTRSDVYTLGVIAFELLAYKVSHQLHEAVQTIREEDPEWLSSISRTYRGDIETIVRKALEKDKERRYASAAAMAEDFQRYLSDEPIAARPPSTSYQLKKFARRHTSLLVAGAVVFAVLIGGIVASTSEATRAHQAELSAAHTRDQALAEKSRADSEAAISKAIQDFLENDLLRAASPEGMF